MSGETVQGLADSFAMFGRLPGAAREQLGVELALLGREALDAQRAAVPVGATGALKAGLSLVLLLNQLRVRVGLIGVKRGADDLFYGRIVNFGRSAQTVWVRRRARIKSLLPRTRYTRNAGAVVAAYALRVRQEAPRDFIDAPGADFDRLAAGQLAEFWSRTLARAEAA